MNRADRLYTVALIFFGALIALGLVMMVVTVQQGTEFANKCSAEGGRSFTARGPYLCIRDGRVIEAEQP